MNTASHLIVAIQLLLCLLHCIVTEKQQTTEISCEPVEYVMCQNMEYNFTSFPTARFKRQADAVLELHQFYPLVKIGCSESIQEFLCYTYLPECTASHEVIYPCRSMCEEAKPGCEDIMEKFGFSWPSVLSCENFSETNCKALDSQQSTARPINCEPIESTMCRNMEYNFTSFPTARFERQSDATLELHQFYPLIQIGCSKYLQEFLCYSYLPECTPTHEVIYPCRSMCEEAKRFCYSAMQSFGFTWPSSLSCENFSETKCIDSKQTTERQCEKLDVPMCKYFGYNTTRTIIGNTSYDTYRQNLIKWMDNLANHVSVECRYVLERFICLAYYSPCGMDQPCRSFCKKVTKVCSPEEIPTMKWLIHCKDFPVESYVLMKFLGKKCTKSNEVVIFEDSHTKRLMETRRLAKMAKTDADFINKVIDRLETYANRIDENTNFVDSGPIKAIIFDGLRSSIAGLRSNAHLMSTFLNLIEN
ncbi:uncharacterized protein LOC120344696 isoform X2 [Styela clava]